MTKAAGCCPQDRAKNGHEHVVLLPAQATEFLQAHKADQEAQGINSPFVFPQKANTHKPIVSETVIHAWADTRKALGLPQAFKTHSLRHAALTWAARERRNQRPARPGVQPRIQVGGC